MTIYYRHRLFEVDAESELDVNLPDGTIIYAKDTKKMWVLRDGAYFQMGKDIGYTLHVQALTSSPADGATVHFGNLPKAPNANAANCKVYIPQSGTITRAEIYCFAGTAGTNEAWSLNVRLNDTTDTLIDTLSVSASERVFSNSALSIPVVAGDWFCIKSVQPTWVTNPLTTIYGGYIYIE